MDSNIACKSCGKPGSTPLYGQYIEKYAICPLCDTKDDYIINNRLKSCTNKYNRIFKGSYGKGKRQT